MRRNLLPALSIGLLWGCLSAVDSIAAIRTQGMPVALFTRLVENPFTLAVPGFPMVTLSRLLPFLTLNLVFGAWIADGYERDMVYRCVRRGYVRRWYAEKVILLTLTALAMIVALAAGYIALIGLLFAGNTEWGCVHDGIRAALANLFPFALNLLLWTNWLSVVQKPVVAQLCSTAFVVVCAVLLDAPRFVGFVNPLIHATFLSQSYAVSEGVAHWRWFSVAYWLALTGLTLTIQARNYARRDKC